MAQGDTEPSVPADAAAEPAAPADSVPEAPPVEEAGPPPSDGSAQDLPPVEVVTSAPKPKPRKPAASRPGRAADPGPPAAAPAVPAPVDALDIPTGGDAYAGETATGPVQGYIATRSATGTRTDTPIIETPQGIAVVGQEQIQQQGAQSIEEALTYTSGVRAEVYGFNPIAGGINIRGFEVLQNFRDGMLSSPDVQPEPFGLERVEVLKGPAAVMYGESAPGGIVNAVSKRPLEKSHHLVEGEIGNFDRFQGAFDIGGKVGNSSNLFYRATLLARDSNTQVDFVPDNRLYFAPALTWKVTPKTTLTWLSYYQWDDTQYVVDVPAQGSVLPNPPYGRVPRKNNLGIPHWDTRVNNIWSTGYEFEHRFTERFKVRQALRYSDLDAKYRWSFPYTEGGRIDPTTLFIFSTESPYTEGMFTVDTNAVLDFNTGKSIKHKVLFGTDYRFAKRDDVYYDTDAGPLDIYNPVYPVLGPLFHWEDNGSEAGQLGFYLQDQLKIGDHLTVLVGGRQDLADRFDYAIDYFSADTPIYTSTTQEDEAFTWRAGFVYLFDNGLAPYFSYSTAFEPSIGVDRFNVPFDPTTAEQFEGGVRFQPKNKQSFVTLSAFDITQANVLTTDPFDPDELIQTGEVSSKGFEAEATLDLATGLNAIATYTYTYAIVTESEDPLEVGTRFEAVPLNMASLWLLYAFQHGTLEGWGIGGGVRYVGETFNRLNTLTIPAYTLVDARLQYAVKGWEFSLNGRNIFDDTYVSWCGEFFPDPTYFSRCRYGDARTVVARARYQW